MRTKQFNLFKKQDLAYGGILLNTRNGREHGRPLSTKNTMHLTLRSSQARGEKSFLKKGTAGKIQSILRKFSAKYGIKLISVANVGNHLHIHLKLGTRRTYAPFIRAITSAISMAATGISRWSGKTQDGSKKFWDYRPFTRVVVSLRGWLNMQDYLKINQLEGQGYARTYAQALVWMSSGRWRPISIVGSPD